MIWSARTYEARGYATRRDHLLPVVASPETATPLRTALFCVAALPVVTAFVAAVLS